MIKSFPLFCTTLRLQLQKKWGFNLNPCKTNDIHQLQLMSEILDVELGEMKKLCHELNLNSTHYYGTLTNISF